MPGADSGSADARPGDAARCRYAARLWRSAEMTIEGCVLSSGAVWRPPTRCAIRFDRDLLSIWPIFGISLPIGAPERSGRCLHSSNGLHRTARLYTGNELSYQRVPGLRDIGSEAPTGTAICRRKRIPTSGHAGLTGPVATVGDFDDDFYDFIPRTLGSLRSLVNETPRTNICALCRARCRSMPHAARPDGFYQGSLAAFTNPQAANIITSMVEVNSGSELAKPNHVG